MAEHQRKKSVSGRSATVPTKGPQEEPQSPSADAFDRHVANAWIGHSSYRQYKSYWWMLWLECNHTVRWKIEYKDGKVRGICAFLDEKDILSAPTALRCEVCTRNARLEDELKQWPEYKEMEQRQIDYSEVISPLIESKHWFPTEDDYDDDEITESIPQAAGSLTLDLDDDDDDDE
jgi:hypothetical protein